jgi:uncharacterized repeat protein (TIGR01451 family)
MKINARPIRPLKAVLITITILLLIAAFNPFSVFADEADGGYYDHTFIAYKFASKHSLGPQDSLTFTILLYNSSTDTVTADVVDTLPLDLGYLPGTASGGGEYDAATHSLSWSAVEVPFASQVLLTFDVEAPSVIAEMIDVVNSAEITTDKNTIETEFEVRLLPQSPTADVVFPVVDSVIIDEMDALTSRDVTLYISASDNIGLDKMMIKEWQVGGGTEQGWIETQSSGWIPYDTELEWTLGDKPGVKFIGVWVADAAGNTSFGTREAFDFASYLKPATSFSGEIGIVPYPVYYEAGVDVTATLDWMGDENSSAMLLVWFPGEFDEAADSDSQEITFTTETAGTYIFAVSVTADVELTYTLGITPGGGPSALGMESAFTPIETESTDTSPESTYYNLLFAIGLDPISIALEDQPLAAPPVTADKVYLPLLSK